MPNSKQQEEVSKRLDEQLSKSIAEMIDYGAETKDFHQMIKSFIQSEIEIALDNQMKEIMIAWEEGDSFNSFKERLKRAGLISKD